MSNVGAVGKAQTMSDKATRDNSRDQLGLALKLPYVKGLFGIVASSMNGCIKCTSHIHRGWLAIERT
jgi:hypothetical protein